MKITFERGYQKNMLIGFWTVIVHYRPKWKIDWGNTKSQRKFWMFTKRKKK